MSMLFHMEENDQQGDRHLFGLGTLFSKAPSEAEKSWRAFAREAISEILSQSNFFDIKKTVHIFFVSQEDDPEFNHQSKFNEKHSVFLGEPYKDPLLGSWANAKDQKSFLQLAFITEIGHAVFDTTFQRMAHANQEILRTIPDASGESLFDQIKEPIVGQESDRDILVGLLGQRIQEQFADVLSVLAGNSLGISDETFEYLREIRSAEKFLDPYDTSKGIQAAMNVLAAGNADTSSLFRCASIAKEIVLKGFQEDLRVLGIESEEVAARHALQSIKNEPMAFFKAALSERRASRNAIQDAESPCIRKDITRPSGPG